MLPRVHSRTAEATAAIRACHLAHDRPLLFEDPFALGLTSPLWRAVCRRRWLYRLVVRGMLRGLRPVHGWILIRDRLTEEALAAAVAGGLRQFVLLGAGFDSTALRRPPWLEGVRIFEVDHPATQAVKLARMAHLGAAPLGSDFEAVAVDFERESLAQGMARSSFERDAPALFAWQGVIYYLSPQAIADTLRDVADLAAPGSTLLLDFLLPPESLARGAGRVMSFAGMFTARLGERYVSYHSVEQIEALLEQAGLEVVRIRLDPELEADYFADRDDDLSVMRGFGIAHARKP